MGDHFIMNGLRKPLSTNMTKGLRCPSSDRRHELGRETNDGGVLHTVVGDD